LINNYSDSYVALFLLPMHLSLSFSSLSFLNFKVSALQRLNN